jgi:hypothetical protein
MNGAAGNPGVNLPAKPFEGRVGVLVGVAPCKMPAARSLSRRELVSGTGVGVDGVTDGALKAGCGWGGGERTGAADCAGGVGCGVEDCLTRNAARAPGPNRELKEGCWAGG